MAAPRVSYRRRMHYNTRSNKHRLIRTPGNRLLLQKRAKRHQGVHCPWVLGHKRLQGTKALDHFDRRHQAGHRASVSRPYGGVLSHDQVRDRIVRAFLIEEQRMVRKVLQAEAKFRRDKKRRDRKQKKAVARRVASGKSKAAPGKKQALASKKVSKAAPVVKKPVAKNTPVGAKLVKK